MHSHCPFFTQRQHAVYTLLHLAFFTNNVSLRYIVYIPYEDMKSFLVLSHSIVWMSYSVCNRAPMDGHWGVFPLVVKMLGLIFLSLKKLYANQSTFGLDLGGTHQAEGHVGQCLVYEFKA